MLGICPSFIQYLSETAPSLFYQVPLDTISFRWKIPSEEFLSGWTSPKSGVDIIKELRTDEICGFTGIHFPGKRFLLENNEGFGECLELIRQKSIEASQVGCLLQYATEETERPVVLTRHEFFKLFPCR